MVRLFDPECLVEVELKEIETFGLLFHLGDPIATGRLVVHVSQAVAVGIHRAAVAEGTSEQLVYRLSGDLARQIPQRDVNAADGTGKRRVRMLHGRHAVEVLFDGQRVGTHQLGQALRMTPTSKRCRQGQVIDMRAGHRGVGSSLAVADQAGIGLNSDQAAVELKVELHRLDGGNLYLAFVGSGECAVLRHPSACGSGQRGS